MSSSRRPWPGLSGLLLGCLLGQSRDLPSASPVPVLVGQLPSMSLARYLLLALCSVSHLELDWTGTAGWTAPSHRHPSPAPSHCQVPTMPPRCTRPHSHPRSYCHPSPPPTLPLQHPLPSRLPSSSSPPLAVPHAGCSCLLPPARFRLLLLSAHAGLLLLLLSLAAAAAAHRTAQQGSRFLFLFLFYPFRPRPLPSRPFLSLHTPLPFSPPSKRSL